MNRRLVKLLLATAVIGCAAIGLGVVESVPGTPNAGGVTQVFSLSVPAFAQSISAARFPSSEAGISAYLKLALTLDFDKARPFFRGIQAEGSDYLVGIVELAGLPEDVWPHLYVSKDGWLVAYYSKYDPASKLMPWKDYTGGPIDTTTLRDALAQFTTQLLDSMQATFSFTASEKDLHYYDFRYPEARAFVLAADSVDAKEPLDSLRYAIPTGVTVYDGSWAHYAVKQACCPNCGGCGSNSKADDETLFTGRDGTYYKSGQLSEQALRREQAHAVTVSQWVWDYSGTDRIAGVAVAFVYK
ncbi:MAG: hypothetical protein NTX23_09800 [Candidatus Bipolaricaulota bacterium]|nr:hypothetical protein [Candidatus Bipolaricaulota bacterium]